MKSPIYCILGRRLEIQPILCGLLALCILFLHLDYLIPDHLKAKTERSLAPSASMWLDMTCLTPFKIPNVMFSEVVH